ncbi:MAG: hypothetical protein H0X29_07015 [Parachlamydiaceae bacterium]|nr:hypothetical protein [Parachlamydiaceae bacterium]
MQYSIEVITLSSQKEMLNFLKEYETYTLFLLGNYENYGPILSDALYSGNFKLIRSQGQVVGVFALLGKVICLLKQYCKSLFLILL